MSIIVAMNEMGADRLSLISFWERGGFLSVRRKVQRGDFLVGNERYETDFNRFDTTRFQVVCSTLISRCRSILMTESWA